MLLQLNHDYSVSHEGHHGLSLTNNLALDLLTVALLDTIPNDDTQSVVWCTLARILENSLDSAPVLKLVRLKLGVPELSSRKSAITMLPKSSSLLRLHSILQRECLRSTEISCFTRGSITRILYAWKGRRTRSWRCSTH